MKTILLLLLLPFVLFSQKVDTVIKNKVYESHFSYKLKQPVFVKYKLYKGGGNCNRSQFTFKTGGVRSATKDDYVGSGFDIGHLANAEDFAYDCKKEELTFRFYNAIPQYPNLNRGIWKTIENRIRELSQTDSLLIICGGIYVNEPGNKIPNTQVQIPKYCWKVVKSLTTGHIIICVAFTNEKENNSIKYLTLERLKALLKYKIPI